MSDPKPSPSGEAVPTYTPAEPPLPTPREDGVTLSKMVSPIPLTKPVQIYGPIVKQLNMPRGASSNVSQVPEQPRPVPLPTPADMPPPVYPPQTLPDFIYFPSLTPQMIADYRAARERDKREGCLVTFIMPAVGRTECTKAVVEGIVKHACFPHRLKLIIHPKLDKLQTWSRNLGAEVHSGWYFPIVKAKEAIVKLCDTKYLFMFDNDLQPSKPLKPMLDFMEAHPDVGVCACSLEGSPKHSVLHYGSDFHVTNNRIFVVESLRKVSPLRYCNYVHHGATLFRMEVFKEVAYDTVYPGQGHEHEDLFLQLAKTKWKVVSFNDCPVYPIPEGGPSGYRSVRNKGLKDSYEYFRRKWNIKSKSRGVRK